MNRRSFLTKLAVGIVAAPVIVKALAHEDPYRCVITPMTKKYTLRSSAWTVRSPLSLGEEDVRRAYAEAMEKAMRGAGQRYIDQVIDARLKHY